VYVTNKIQFDFMLIYKTLLLPPTWASLPPIWDIYCSPHPPHTTPVLPVTFQKHTYPWVAPLFSQLQLATGTSCNKHSNWTVLSQSLHSKTRSWTLLLTVVAALYDVLLSLPSWPLCCWLCPIMFVPCVVLLSCCFLCCVAALLCCCLKSLFM
jgi:hypothetical protein